MFKIAHTGREPKIVSSQSKGKQRLSLRRLGTLLNLLPPDAVSLDAIQEMLHSHDVHVRYNAAKLLATRGDRNARLIMEDAFEHGNPRSQATIIRQMHHFSWYSAESLIKKALASDEAPVREAAIYALCDMASFNAYRLMQQVLDSEEDSVLEAAAFGLRETYDTGAVPVLQKVLKAIDPEIRVKALDALGICGAPEAIPIVREALLDKNPEVKYAAVLTLLELAREAWLDELATVITQSKGRDLEEILKAFFHASNYLKIDVLNSSAATALLNALENALQDEAMGVRIAALWSVAWLRHERSPQLIQAAYAAEKISEAKAEIVRISVSLMSQVSEIILGDALESADELLREAAQKIIAERERTGIILSYDENAYQGRVMDRTLRLGKLDKNPPPPS